ncbi:MAG: isochorismatase family protein, partial [Calditrichaeota bacterium]|nr:isochorismatase family protein [Calditrichota bacterium]
MARRVLLVIDMLKDFIYDDGALTCGKPAQDIVPYIQELLADFRQAGDKVIYLADAHSPDDPEFEMFPPHCIAGTRG